MSDEPKYRDEEWLREQYWENEKSTRDIADECGCGPETVRRWMKRHGLKRRAGGGRPADERLADRAWLREQYVEECLSTYDIAKKWGFSQPTVLNWLKRHNINTRGRGAGKQVDDERLRNGDWLREQYSQREREVAEIAEQIGCSSYTVYSQLHEFNIKLRGPTRPSGNGHPNWNGGPQTYGPGWNASKRRQVRERDGHRCQDCGTTQAEHKAEYDQKLHVHHLIKARDIDDPEERNAPENLITLCRDCHQRWERLSEAGIRPQIDGVTAD